MQKTVGKVKDLKDEMEKLFGGLILEKWGWL